MHKHFNTSELKQFYEAKKNEYLINDKMRWFIDTRNTVTKEHPFKLEKAISFKVYTVNNNYDEFVTLLTIDYDKKLSELLDEIHVILEKYNKNSIEVFFSIFILFIENGKEIDVFDQVILGIKTMWNFINDTRETYPCNCKKCVSLFNMITTSINNIQIKHRMLFQQDCHYYKGKIKKGSMVKLHLMDNGIYDKKKMRFNLATNPLFGNDVCKDDILLLKSWALNQIIILDSCLEKSNKQPELLATFCLVFEDNTAELTEMFSGTLKTTYYRMANEIAARVKKENIRAVLYACETVYFPLEYYLEPQIKSSNERQEEAQGTFLYTLIVSKKLNNIMAIGFDYSKLDDKNYKIKQLNNPEKMPNDFLIYPIFKAMKE